MKLMHFSDFVVNGLLWASMAAALEETGQFPAATVQEAIRSARFDQTLDTTPESSARSTKSQYDTAFARDDELRRKAKLDPRPDSERHR